MNKHELFDFTIHECILVGASQAIELTAGQELPKLFVNYEAKKPEGFDEERDELQITVQYYEAIDFNGTCWNVEGSFSVPESVFKGIAARRPKDLQAFVDILLPGYRAESISMGLQHELHNDLRSLDPEDYSFSSADERMLSNIEVSELMLKFGTALWFICDVGVEAVSKELFRLDVVFRNEVPSVTLSQDGIDYDLLTLSTSLSWGEYKAAMTGKGRLISLLCRIHETFIVTKADLPGRYSPELEQELERLDWEEEDEDDPFTSGELKLDADGRVHFTHDCRG